MPSDCEAFEPLHYAAVQGEDKGLHLENLCMSIQKMLMHKKYCTLKGDSRPLSALSPCISILSR